MGTEINVDVGTLPAALECKLTQAQYEALASQLSVELPDDYTSIIASQTVPGVDNQDKPWLKLDANGDPEDLYYYSTNYGYWVSKYPVEEDSDVGRIWYGAEADVVALGGNDDGNISPTAIAGPFWQVKTELAARMPIGVGSLPSGTAIAAGGTGGAETVTLTTDQIPAHQHSIDTVSDAAGGGSANYLPYDGGLPADGTKLTSSVGGGQSHTNMPPYYGVYFLKRTARKYRRIAPSA